MSKIELEFLDFETNQDKLVKNKKYLVLWHHDLTMLKDENRISTSVWGQYKHESACIWRDISPQSTVFKFAEFPENILS